jgi:hypothetical protein
MLLAGLVGCGKDEFSSARNADAGDSGSGGAAGSHDAGASTGGARATGGAQATGGMHGVDAGAAESGAGDDGSVREGSASKACSPIHTFAELRDGLFGNPEVVTKLNDAAGTDSQLRHPRAFGNGGALLYETFFFTGTVWLTGDPDTDIGAPMSSLINPSGGSATSPFWWQDARPGPLAKYNFVWNRGTGKTDDPMDLYGATVDGAGIATTAERLPAPFNAPKPTVQSSSGLALSRDRAWWTANLDSSFNVHLYTAPLDGSSPPSLLSLVIENDCELHEFDFGAWVTPDGKLLLVNASERDATCSYNVDAPSDIYAFDLDETGKPIGKGHALAINRPGTTEADASLSPDFCTLYYAANDAPNEHIRIHRIRRTR